MCVHVIYVEYIQCIAAWLYALYINITMPCHVMYMYMYVCSSRKSLPPKALSSLAYPKIQLPIPLRQLTKCL